MTQRFKDKGRTTLASFLSDSATSLSVAAGTGDLFPEVGATTPGGTDWFKAVLEDETGDYEIIYVYTRSDGSDLFADVVRAQEGTTAREWPSGETVVGLRVTGKDMEDMFNRTFWNIPESNPDQVAGAKTIQKADVGKHVEMDGGNVGVSPNVFAKGDIVVVVNNSATPRVLVSNAGVTVRWVEGATGNRTIRPWGIASVFCLSPNVFIVTGQGVE